MMVRRPPNHVKDAISVAAAKEANRIKIYKRYSVQTRYPSIYSAKFQNYKKLFEFFISTCHVKYVNCYQPGITRTRPGNKVELDLVTINNVTNKNFVANHIIFF